MQKKEVREKKLRRRRNNGVFQERSRGGKAPGLNQQGKVIAGNKVLK
jgi:hypothetical protein